MEKLNPSLIRPGLVLPRRSEVLSSVPSRPPRPFRPAGLPQLDTSGRLPRLSSSFDPACLRRTSGLCDREIQPFGFSAQCGTIKQSRFTPPAGRRGSEKASRPRVLRRLTPAPRSSEIHHPARQNPIDNENLRFVQSYFRCVNRSQPLAIRRPARFWIRPNAHSGDF